MSFANWAEITLKTAQDLSGFGEFVYTFHNRKT